MAAQLGVPVIEAIRLDGVVTGMGATAAGLRADDVIVGMAGRDVVDWATLSDALSKKQAGDAVEIVFHRGPEQHAVEMILSGWPIPEIPETAQALAAAARERYAEIESELEAFLDGVSDAAAGYMPEPDAGSHVTLQERTARNSIRPV